MSGFSMSPDELITAAQVMRRAVGELDELPATRYSLDPDEMGNPELAAALREFQKVSEEVVGLLRADTGAMADHVAFTASDVVETDQRLADLITGQ